MWWIRFTGGSVAATVKRCTADEVDNSPHAIRAEREHAKLDPIFQQIRMEQEAGTLKQSKHAMLTRAIWRCYRSELIQAALLKLGWSIFIVTAIAYFIRSILIFLQVRAKDPDHTPEKESVGIILCVFFTICCAILSIFLQQTNWVSARLGLKVQSAVTTQIYIKALCRAEGTGSKADIVAMVAKDVTKIADACAQLQFLWSGVFEAIVIFAVLLGFIDYNALPALGVFVVMLPLQYKLGLWIARKKGVISKLSSERALLTEEILRAMKLIKTYAWETSFFNKLTDIRNEEMNLYKWQTAGKTLLIASVFNMPPIFVAAIFGVYNIRTDVTGAIAFTTLTLFNTLRLPLVKLPKALRDCTDAVMAIERIESYLLEPEVDPKDETHAAVAPGVCMRNASFSHGFASPIPYLNNISLDVEPGTLTMVAGSVGTGKSSLLKAILGQLHLTAGSSQVGGTYAYVPQSPWCALGTVRDNILFGNRFDKEFYDKVCHACSLERDFQLFKDGDMEWIGERGGNLSGGQKQRIALARACYSQNDIIVLDSPLSAVDMHTCQHIFKHCIQELMIGNGRTVVLATHQVELFCHADNLVIMEDAQFKYSGPYNAQTVQKLFPNAALGDAVPKNKTRTPAAALPRNAQALLMSGSDAPRGQFPPPSAAPGKGLDIVVEGTKQPVVRAPILIDSNKQGGGGFVELVKNWTLLLAVPLYLFIFTGAQAARTFSDIWISQWTAKKNNWGPHKLISWEYFGVYVSFVFVFFCMQLLRGTWYFRMGIGATRKIHANSFGALMVAPMSFFNLTPIGKTLNFFSRDMDVMDDNLHDNIYMVSIYLWLLGFTFYVLISNVPIYAIIIGGCVVIFLYFFYFYLKASKQLKLFLGAATGNVVSHTAETLTGLAVVRAFRKEAQFLRTNMTMQDDVYRAGAELNNCNHWIAVRVDALGVVLVGCTVFLAVLLKDAGITDSAAGLMVSNCIQILLFFTASVTLFGEINTQVTAVERALALKKVEPERDLDADDKNAVPPEGWPAQGGVVFNNVHMSYMPGLPPVLKGCSFRFEPGQKIGVVGRTGAGKSTLIMAMFRLAETSEGSIHIDGIKNDSIRLQQLRSNIAIIPQEPIMFKGTVRSNLDPFGRYTDSQLVDAMERCLLHSLIDQHAKDFGLSAPVEVFGGNYSLGQQQLICLARAMLTPSKLLLLDEATAALDSDTDAAVQKVLRENFKDRTIMTIAHRLDTIIDSDKILAMDAGKVGEFDSPQALLANPKSIFTELCKNAGEHEYKRLLEASGNKAGRTAGAVTRAPIRPMVHQDGHRGMAPHGMPRFASPMPPMPPSMAPHPMMTPMMPRGGSPPMMIPLGMPYPHGFTISPPPMSPPHPGYHHFAPSNATPNASFHFPQW